MERIKNLNWKKIGLYFVLGFLTLIIGSSGVTKLVSNPEWIQAFNDYGYPLWFMYFIGVVQVVGSILIWFPKARFWVGGAFAVIMIGAAYSHFSIAEYGPIIQNVIIFGLSVLVMWIYRDSFQALRPA